MYYKSVKSNKAQDKRTAHQSTRTDKKTKREDKKMLKFKNKNTDKKIVYENGQFMYTDGQPVVSKNQNGKITPTFKNGLNENGDKDKTAIYRIIIDVDENGKKMSYSLTDENNDLTQDLLNEASRAFLDGATLTVGKRPPEQNGNGNGDGRTKKAKLAIFELPTTYVQKLFLTEYAETVEKYGQYIDVADTLKVFGDLQATTALFERADKDYADTLASIEQKRKDERASENLFNKFVDLTDEQKAAFLAMLGQKA